MNLMNFILTDKGSSQDKTKIEIIEPINLHETLRHRIFDHEVSFALLESAKGNVSSKE